GAAAAGNAQARGVDAERAAVEVERAAAGDAGAVHSQDDADAVVARNDPAGGIEVADGERSGGRARGRATQRVSDGHGAGGETAGAGDFQVIGGAGAEGDGSGLAGDGA